MAAGRLGRDEGALARPQSTRNAHATPNTPPSFSAELVHTHTGANKAKLEHAVREALAEMGEGGVAAIPPGGPLYPVEPKPAGGWV